MASHKFELSDSSSENLTMGSGRGKSNGCYLSIPIAFVLTFLAIAIAVGVGVIVFFAAGKGVVSTCENTDVSGGNTAGQGDDTKPTSKPVDPVTDGPTVDPCMNCPCTGPSLTTDAPPAITTQAPVVDVRLPTDLNPLHYNVELQPNIYDGDPKEFTFNGTVSIDIECQKATDLVTLHTNKLNITNVRFAAKTGDTDPINIVATGFEIDTVKQFFTLSLNRDLVEGAVYTLDMDFVGPLADDLAGLYRSQYYDKTQNRTIHIATSQMQPTDARKTFPCFDEPAIKSNFTVTLVRKEPMISLSNMPIANAEDRGDGWWADHYETTVKMPTYLLAFIVCDFKYVEKNTTTGVTVRVWARREAINQTEYALQAGVDITEYFEKYFNVTFPLPKQDMIAIPDFAAGAMENWGLITYRETALLYDPLVSSASNKQRVAVVVSHELAHQWFGNLVSPKWWDDLWLNEGFASYVEYIGVDHIEPTWAMKQQFITEDLQDVMRSDGLGSSHPIFVPVNHPDEINEIFDRISYAKGASIIRMMNFFLTEDTFRQGLSNYLKALAYGPATHNDLWNYLTQADVGKRNLDVKTIMDTWTLQMGFPVVSVARTGNQLSLTQSHFLFDPTQPPSGKYPPPFDYKWQIPFTSTSQSEMDWSGSNIDWMQKADATTTAPLRGSPRSEDWYIANVQEFGYYKVNYDSSNWDKLIVQLSNNHTAIHVINRAQLIDDAFSLQRSGQANDPLLHMKTTEYLINETDYLPWDAALINLNYISRMLKRSAYYGYYEKYMLKQIRPLYDAMGWNDRESDPHLDQYKRIYALDHACARGYQPCRDNASALYKEWMEKSDPDMENPIRPNLKSLVYCNAISNGGVKEWDFAYKRYINSNVASEKSKLLYSMACSRTVWILSRYLNWTLDTSRVRKQDATSTIISISRNSIGRSLAWDFVRANFEYIRGSYGTGFFSFSNLLSGITSSFNTEFDLQQLREFKDKYPDLGSGSRAFDQAIEKAQSNIKWMNDNEERIGMWLKDRAY